MMEEREGEIRFRERVGVKRVKHSSPEKKL